MPGVVQNTAEVASRPTLESGSEAGDVGASPITGTTPGHVRTEADEFLDLMEESMGRAQDMQDVMEGHELTKEELEFELQLCAAFRREATVRLHPEGIRVQSWKPDGHGLGYVIVARDRQQRRFEVEFQYGQVLEGDVLYRPDSLQRGPEEFGRGVIEDVCKALLSAREKYLQRAQCP